MGGKYPTAYRKGAQQRGGFQPPLQGMTIPELMEDLFGIPAAPSANDNLPLPANDNRPPPGKGPNPLSGRPAWMEPQRSARGILRTAARISPLGRIMDVYDAVEPFYNLHRLKAPQAGSGYNMTGWEKVTGCEKPSGGPYQMQTPMSCNQAWASFTAPQPGIGQNAEHWFVTFLDQYTPGVPAQARNMGYYRMLKSQSATMPNIQAVPTPAVFAPQGNPNPLFQPSETLHWAPSAAAAAAASAVVPRKPPPAGTKEKKAMAHGPGIKAVKAAVNAVTESLDFFNAFYDALPAKVRGCKDVPGMYDKWGEQKQKCKSLNVYRKAALLAKNFDQVDPEEVIKNLIKNQIEDAAIGKLASKAGPFGGKYGRPIGFTAGPAL